MSLDEVVVKISQANNRKDSPIIRKLNENGTKMLLIYRNIVVTYDWKLNFRPCHHRFFLIIYDIETQSEISIKHVDFNEYNVSDDVNIYFDGFNIYFPNNNVIDFDPLRKMMPNIFDSQNRGFCYKYIHEDKEDKYNIEFYDQSKQIITKNVTKSAKFV